MKKEKKFLSFIFLAVFVSALFFISANALAADEKAESKIVSPFDVLQVKIPGLDALLKTDEAQMKCFGEGKDKVCEYPWVGIYIKAVYKFLVGISGMLAVIVMMAGGYYWLFAGGNAGRVTQAKEYIGGAVMGLALALGSYMILNLINPEILTLKPIKIGAVQEIKVLQKSMEDKTGKTADDFEAKSCSASGTYEAYFTAYCKPDASLWGYSKINSIKNAYFPDEESKNEFFCYVGLNCSCPPPGRNESKNCFNNNPNHHPCYDFDPGITDYCEKPAVPLAKLSESNGSIAAPRCIPDNAAVCIGSKKYYVHDRGGKQTIAGRHFDMWKDNCKTASSPGIKTITVLSSPTDPCP